MSEYRKGAIPRHDHETLQYKAIKVLFPSQLVSYQPLLQVKMVILSLLPLIFHNLQIKLSCRSNVQDKLVVCIFFCSWLYRMTYDTSKAHIMQMNICYPPLFFWVVPLIGGSCKVLSNLSRQVQPYLSGYLLRFKPYTLSWRGAYACLRSDLSTPDIWISLSISHSRWNEIEIGVKYISCSNYNRSRSR